MFCGPGVWMSTYEFSGGHFLAHNSHKIQISKKKIKKAHIISEFLAFQWLLVVLSINSRPLTSAIIPYLFCPHLSHSSPRSLTPSPLASLHKPGPVLLRAFAWAIPRCVHSCWLSGHVLSSNTEDHRGFCDPCLMSLSPQAL